MPWMDVMMLLEGGGTAVTVVNTDTISRFGPVNADVTYLKFTDGSSIHVSDSIEEITQVVLKADEKKK